MQLDRADVGGAVVFPRIGLKVDADVGDAVVWFNLLGDGTENIRARHAACPVLIGQKWGDYHYIRKVTLQCINLDFTTILKILQNSYSESMRNVCPSNVVDRFYHTFCNTMTRFFFL